MPSRSTISRCRPTSAEQNAGNDEDVQREEARERWPGDDGAAQHQIHQRAADERHAAQDRRADAEPPVGVLIEAQNLSRKCHAQREQQQEDADDPGKFAREFVGAEEKDLHQVNQHDGDHEIRTPAVQRAQIPAQPHIVIEKLEAAPRMAGSGSIDQREQNAGHHLQNQNHGRRAAEDIPPA